MRVVELAVREALRAGANEIRGEHILIGLITEGEGVPAQVLVGMGVNRDRVIRHLRYGGRTWLTLRQHKQVYGGSVTSSRR